MNEHEDVRRYLEYITDSLFSSAGINRSVFQKKDMKASLPSNYLNYVIPFSMNEETRQVKTNLATIVSSSNIDCNTQIQTLSKEYLESVLQLEPPKKVIQYSAIAGTDNSKSKVAPKAPRQSRGKAKVMLPPGAGGVDLLDDEDLPNPMRVVPPPAKRSRVSHTGLPMNFYEVVTPLFQEFWGKQFADKSVTFAFFAIITSYNCKEYQLPVFAEQSYALPVIKDKLDYRKYISAEEFAFDFQQLFTNILRFYPDGHPAIAAAKELQQVFDSRWKAIEAQFVW